MQWGVVIKDVETGAIRVIRDDDAGEYQDSVRFERHVAPGDPVGEGYNFGEHEFTRNCICRPQVQTRYGNEVVIVHADRKPN